MVCLASLRRGISTGCKGCSIKDHWTVKRGPDHIPRITNTRWYRLLQGAQTRKREVTITKEDAVALFVQQNGRCALTDWPIALPTRARGRGTASLDRRDNKCGYVHGNVQWTHWRINRMKNVLAEDEFIEACGAVTNHRGTERTGEYTT
jgi:hypothetical protein